MDDSFAVNRASWDERAPAHAASPDYGVERFAADPTYLSDVVTFDRPRLGDVRGELEFPDYGQIFAHCRIGRGPWLVVPFTLLPPV